MKAMILAAGRGERMRPLTDRMPKPLLAVNGKPLIVYHLEKLSRLGVAEVIINHAWLGQELENTLGDGHQWGLKITYSPEPAGGLETAGGIINALPLLGEQPFWVINGDIWTTLDFASLPVALGRGDVANLMLVNNPAHNSDGDFAVNGDRLLARRPGQAHYTYSGIGLFEPAWFAGRAVERLPLRPLFDEAVGAQRIAATVNTACDWFDIGTPQRLEQLDTQLRGSNDLG